MSMTQELEGVGMRTKARTRERANARRRKHMNSVNQLNQTAGGAVLSREDERAKAARTFAELKGAEIESLRQINIKYYDLGAGRRQAITFAEPVHFLARGGWEEIDNRLYATKSAKGVDEYKTRAGRSRSRIGTTRERVCLNKSNICSAIERICI